MGIPILVKWHLYIEMACRGTVSVLRLFPCLKTPITKIWHWRQPFPISVSRKTSSQEILQSFRALRIIFCCPIALKFDRHLVIAVGKAPVRFQSNPIILSWLWDCAISYEKISYVILSLVWWWVCLAFTMEILKLVGQNTKMTPKFMSSVWGFLQEFPLWKKDCLMNMTDSSQQKHSLTVSVVL